MTEGATTSIVSEDNNNDDDHFIDLDVTMLSMDISVEEDGDDATTPWLSATSHQEASKVLEEWKSEHMMMMQDTMMMIANNNATTPTKVVRAATPVSDNDDDAELSEEMAILMEVDEEIGSNFLNDDVFGGCAAAAAGPVDSFCPSPAGPIDEFQASYYYGYDDDERSLAPFLDEEGQDAVVMALDSVLEENMATNPNVDPEQYRKLLEKLVESMKKSEETRKSLTMKTPKTEKYSRSKTVTGVLTSIEKSSKQLKNYLKTVQKAVG